MPNADNAKGSDHDFIPSSYLEFVEFNSLPTSLSMYPFGSVHRLPSTASIKDS